MRHTTCELADGKTVVTYSRRVESTLDGGGTKHRLVDFNYMEHASTQLDLHEEVYPAGIWLRSFDLLVEFFTVLCGFVFA